MIFPKSVSDIKVDIVSSYYENKHELWLTIALLLFLAQIGIWEERKVFGSRGQILKEEFGARQLESSNRNGKHLGVKLVSNSYSVCWIYVSLKIVSFDMI